MYRIGPYDALLVRVRHLREMEQLTEQEARILHDALVAHLPVLYEKDRTRALVEGGA
jgi:hypothetical protein